MYNDAFAGDWQAPSPPPSYSVVMKGSAPKRKTSTQSRNTNSIINTNSHNQPPPSTSTSSTSATKTTSPIASARRFAQSMMPVAPPRPSQMGRQRDHMGYPTTGDSLQGEFTGSSN